MLNQYLAFKKIIKWHIYKCILSNYNRGFIICICKKNNERKQQQQKIFKQSKQKNSVMERIKK